MRTIVTLDRDVEQLIRASMRTRGLSFNKALNEAARMGLLRNKQQHTRRFVQKSFPLGEAQNFRWDQALAIADALEDEELGRKLSLRK
jgi:hypothetical protein